MIHHLPNAIRQVLKPVMQRILRSLFRVRIATRRLAGVPSGFILPTTMLLLIVVSLAVGSIGLRTLNRTQQTVGERQQQVIYNAATPVLDRARAKIDYLMRNHPKRSTGIPPEDELVAMMLNDETADAIAPFSIQPRDEDGNEIGDIYTFGDEQRLDIGTLAADGGIARSNQADNAWTFEADTDGNGENDAIVAYSILFNTPTDLNDLTNTTATATEDRAANLEVRHGPKSLVQSTDRCPAARASGVEDGWFSDQVSTAFLRKNFQVDAVVVPAIDDGNGNLTANPNATVVTLEFHQDRTYDRGNKWGAWFVNDLEMSSGTQFNWNGAIRTGGSFVVGRRQFNARLISSKFSCFNVPGASEIRVGNGSTNIDDTVEYGGQVVAGMVDALDTDIEHQTAVFVYNGYGEDPAREVLKADTDSVAGDGAATSEEIATQILLDPVKLFTKGEVALRQNDGIDKLEPADWNTQDDTRLDERITMLNTQTQATDQELEELESVSDTYRAKDDDSGPWERKAAEDGTRILVGQRLELGVPLGHWINISCAANPQNTAENRCHEARQRRTLADKLAAVQATAVYGPGSDTPLACIATTVHPGTAQTLQRAATFHDVNQDIDEWLFDPNGDPYIAIEDFFTGRGTNGWEFEPPAMSNEMDTALENLANFAGDPNAGAPYFDVAQDDVVHPYPSFAQFGDFSLLRKFILEGEDDTTIAAKSIKDTAACTLGLLAHNVAYLNALIEEINAGRPPARLPTLAARLTNLENGVGLPPDVIALGLTAGDDADAFVNALEVWQQDAQNGVAPVAAVNDEVVYLARSLATALQVERDRQHGFANGPIACPFTALPGLGQLCPEADSIQYPALYSIFPSANHFEDVPTRGLTDTDPINNYVLNVNGEEYVALDNAAIAAIALKPRAMQGDAGNAWSLPHKATTKTINTTAAPNSPEDVLIRCDTTTVSCDGEHVSVAFKDAGIMDGRQLMNVRVLDVNMDLLRRNNGTFPMLPTEQEAIIYAFREDAVREDSIVRPKNTGDAATCTETEAQVRTDGCRMRAGIESVFESLDPPLAANGRSIKPVDYFPDPDRRPYGFRLRNGERLDRADRANINESISFISDNSVYIFKNFNLHQNANGDRLEEFSGGDLLQDDYGNFDTRGANPNTVDQRFGRTDTDYWRPTEVLSDGLTMLSENFCDGSIVDLFDFSKDTGVTSLANIEDKYGCPASSNFTSYTNYTILTQANAVGDWVRETPDDTSPVSISPNGNPEIVGGEYDRTYDPILGNRRALIVAEETTVNVVMYSRIVPSRFNTTYGGLNNFPMQLEEWGGARDGRPLRIAGAFFQLGFSTAATAPFDQDQWEPVADVPASGSLAQRKFYNAPFRQWGYDVALQKNPPAEIAKEFVSGTPLVSEFYSEPPIDDPYISQLCQRVPGAICP